MRPPIGSTSTDFYLAIAGLCLYCFVIINVFKYVFKFYSTVKNYNRKRVLRTFFLEDNDGYLVEH